MEESLLALLAIVPGVSIAALIWYLDRREREDPRNLVGVFFLGMALVIPALLMQELAVYIGVDEVEDNLFMAAVFAFLIIALTEEAAKYASLRYGLMPRPFIDNPMDGIVFAVMLAMGFATIENINYTVGEGYEIGLFRMFTAVPVHGALAVIMGYFLGQAKFDEPNRKPLLGKAFLIPFGIHGLYDFFVVQESFDWLALGLFPVLIGVIAYAVYLIKKVKDEEKEEIEYSSEQ